MGTNRYSGWAVLGVMTAIFLGATFIVASLMAVVMAFSGDGEWEPMMFVTYTASGVVAVAGGYLYLRGEGIGNGGNKIGLGFRSHLSDAPIILLGVILFTAAGIVIEPLLNLFPDRYFERLNSMVGRGGWTILTLVVAAPIIEEIFFRGLVLESLSRRWKSGAAVAASAALFGLIHLNPPQILNAAVIGVIMGYIYLRSHSLLPVIVIHAINNALAYMQLELLGTQSPDTRELIGNDTLYIVIWGVSAVILAVSIVWLARGVRNKRDEITLHKKD